MKNLECGNPHAALGVCVVDCAVLAEFRAFDLMPALRQGIEPGFDIPFVNSAEMLDDFLGPGRPPDFQRCGAPVCPAADPEMIEPADMIDVMMGREDLVDGGEGNFQRGEILRRPGPAIEEEFFSAGFDEDRRGCLATAREGRSRTQQGYADFIVCEGFPGIKVLAAHRRFSRCFLVAFTNAIDRFAFCRGSGERVCQSGISPRANARSINIHTQKQPAIINTPMT